MYSQRNPMGYKSLRTWQQANEIFDLTEKFASTLPDRHPRTNQKLADTADHMLRSARSVVRNIEEGYNRLSTKEYVNFLGFSMGSLEELLRDYEYCHKGELGDPDMAQEAIRLCRGESKMLNSQVASLNKKMVNELTLPVGERWRQAKEDDKRRDEAFRRDYKKLTGKDYPFGNP